MNAKELIKKIGAKLLAVLKNPSMQEVMNGTVVAFVVKGFGAALTFALNIVIARLLGAQDTGIYFLAFAVATIGSVIGRVGLDNTVMRFVAARAAYEDWSSVKGVHVLAIRICLITAGCVAAFVFLSAPWLATFIFNKGELAEVIRWMSFSIVPMAILMLEGQSLKGLKRISDALAVQGVVVPLLVLLLILPLANTAGVAGVAMAYTIATLIVALLGWWRWSTVARSLDRGPAAQFDINALWNSSKYLFIVALINRAAIPWLPLLFLGAWVSSEETGIFGAATRVAMLVSFMLAAVNNVVAPIYAELFSTKKIERLAKTARFAAILITLLSAPIFLPMLFFGDWVMTLFGSEFESGGDVLAILAFGQLINAAVGPAANLLNMSGFERNNSTITLIAFFIMLVLIVQLVPEIGAVGAALATSCGIITHNVLALLEVRRKLGINLLWV